MPDLGYDDALQWLTSRGGKWWTTPRPDWSQVSASVGRKIAHAFSKTKTQADIAEALCEAINRLRSLLQTP